VGPQMRAPATWSIFLTGPFGWFAVKTARVGMISRLATGKARSEP
jgi:hypothetical protein